MAGLFGFGGVKKAGPGVSKEAPQKNRLFAYFEVFFRKFWPLAFVNLIYCLFFIPAIALSYLLIRLVSDAGAQNAFFYALCFAPLGFLGPANAGLTKVTRDFVRQEPGFTWSDFMEAAKNNWKHSLIVSLFQYFGALCLFAAGSFYYGLMANGGLYAIPFALTIMLAFVYLFMTFYLQLMVVTLDLKLKSLFKNAVILSIVCLGQNLLLMLFCLIFIGIEAGLFYLSLGIPGMLVIFLAFSLMLFFAWLSYTVNAIAFPNIKRLIIDPYYRQNPQETAEGIKKSEKSHEESSPANEELPEYVYENGRMVHRSVIEQESLFEDKLPEKKNKQD